MRQRLGQHFLRDPHAVQTILAAAELKPTDTVLEIGPGRGVLTDPLADRVQQVIAVELDDGLAEHLRARFQSNSRVTIIHRDFLKIELPELAIPRASPDRHSRESGNPEPSLVLDPRFREGDVKDAAVHPPIKVLGNLPYSITSPIFEKLMPWPGWGLGVFLIQREVAERIASRPGSRSFGILTLAVQLFAEVETILQVRPGAFLPPPKVSSTVIRLRRKKTPALPPESIAAFFDLAHGAFAHRRKTLANSLAFFSGVARAPVENWLLRHHISPGRRAETLGLEEYAKLAEAWSIFRRETNLT